MSAINIKTYMHIFVLLWVVVPQLSFAGMYNLEIAQERVNITGKQLKKITVNGGIPGPTLRFMEGEDVVINVTNHMDIPTSIHWHGMLLPPDMDGVPGFSDFPGIAPHETFTYRFKIRQSGTYWYHAHEGSQEQAGHYGSIVITPKDPDPIKADQDYVVLISDFTEENSDAILRNLKMDSGYYNYARRTVSDFFSDIKTKGLREAWKYVREWGQMRMSPTDLSDVSGYTFLVNGKTPDQNWTGIFKPNEKVRLRFINASAMSIYDVRIPGLKMTVVSSDGQNVEPVLIDEFRFGVAETYDVVVQPKEDKAYTIAAESIDRTGFALATLSPHEGMKGELPQQRPRTFLTMEDIGMAHSGRNMPRMDHSKMDMGNMDMPMNHDMSKMDHAAMGHPMDNMDHSMHDMDGMQMEEMKTGWANASTPPGYQALDYKDLRYLGSQKDTREPEREVLVSLGGHMERFIWTINGKKFEDSGPIQLKYGERVRLKFVNETMMAHPMHLHGMFVQLENGQPVEKLPNKHTLIVPPGKSYSVLLTADEAGEWAFHCHLLYHMMAGMMTQVVVEKLGRSDVPVTPLEPEKVAGSHHHAH